MTEVTYTDREDIDLLFKQSIKAYKARDLDGFVNCFDDSVVCLPPEQHPIIGKEAWREWLAAWWNKHKVIEMEVTNHVEIDGDWAIEWHTERQLTTPAEGGDTKERFFKGIFALRRQDDRSWKIARYCWNWHPSPIEGRT